MLFKDAVPSRVYIELYEYVKSGKAPEAWVKGFAECNLLSKAKVEEARQAMH